MRSVDSATHTRGESIYLEDIPLTDGTLHGAIFGSPVACGKIRGLELDAAMRSEGVVAVLTAADIPGDNQIGAIFADEPLLAQNEVHYDGQPVALVIAETALIARQAARRIEVQIDELPPVTDAREARRLGLLIQPPRTFARGDVDSAWAQCAHVVTGEAATGGQEHLYLETQGAYAHPTESGGVQIASSTQGPTGVQRAVARVLGLPMHRVEVDVTRLGGAFGGKEDQATGWAVLAALGAHRLRLPVRVVLHRMDDMRMTGKRHPYVSDFKIGLGADLEILAYDVVFHQNAGAAADLSPAVLERTLFHATNAYSVANVRAAAYSCRTNLPPNTAFRGFGGPQGMFVMEAAIAAAAEQIGIEAAAIQRANLIGEGESFHYGQKVEAPLAVATWERCADRYDLEGLCRGVEAFNAANDDRKQGLALMPICFGISFTKAHMNQASALMHVYQDGSVGISTAAVEMGQGVNTKLVQVAQRVLGLDAGRIKIETTNTTRIANTSPTAASSAADLNGKALEHACLAVRDRLIELAAMKLEVEPGAIELHDGAVHRQGERTEMSWEELVQEAFLARLDLSAHAYYATPGIHFDPVTEKGSPFAYHVWGTAITVATVDCVRGVSEIDAVKVIHDVGRCINPLVDRGQVEGGLVQGIGWLTMEEVLYDEQGHLLSNALSTYKVPDIYGAPKAIEVELYETEGSPHSIFRSKAVGEPPLMYGIGAFFAIRNAILAFDPGAQVPFTAPLTPERILLALYSGEVEDRGETEAPGASGDPAREAQS